MVEIGIRLRLREISRLYLLAFGTTLGALLRVHKYLAEQLVSFIVGETAENTTS